MKMAKRPKNQEERLMFGLNLCGFEKRKIKI